MSVYADTSFLMAAYSPEPESMRVLAWLQSARHPLPFTPLHRLEVRNAIRLRVFRGEITPDQRQQAFQEIESDLEDAILAHIAVPWSDTLREAETLAATHAEKLGARSMDLLHVALALTIGAGEFFSFDARQSALAKAAGLKVNRFS
jgi:predicted nucleic acid-binding protein